MDQGAAKLSNLRPARGRRVKAAPGPGAALPEPFAGWFESRGWSVRAHQLAMLDQVRQRRSTLLIAPTGAGKTLAGFLPSLVALSAGQDGRKAKSTGLHTLYIAPLKALAADVARNLMTPIAEMELKIRCEVRTGDTSVAKRKRQRERPPHFLLTTPEQLALLLSHPDAPQMFSSLQTVILDELHALAPSKRGDLLALDMARLRSFNPSLVTLGLSATVARPTELRAYLAAQSKPHSCIELADLIAVQGGAPPRIEILELDTPVPWAGHSARYALSEVMGEIARHRLTLVFVNTRMQAELVFQELWRINEASLPIALHHGSLDVLRRRKVEAAMAAGALKAVVATSTLDLGIDWGDIDLVINIGAPKGASRLIQRIGRANHRLEEPSEAILIPANRFEVLECRAALEAAAAGEQDAVLSRSGALDVLAQHVLGMACQAPFASQQLYAEVCSALPYAGMRRRDFDRVVDFVSTGGYALRAYERFARLKALPDGRRRIAHPRVAQQYRLNAGTIVDQPMIKVRLVGQRWGMNNPKPLTGGGRPLGEVGESFIDQLSPGDTFAFAGEVLRFEGLRETEAFVSRAKASDPMIPSYAGGKFPLSTHLARRVRIMLGDRKAWAGLPAPVAQWLALQEEHSYIPAADEVLIETFARSGRHYMAIYAFEGRLAHQTLGFLLTRRLERAGARPLGFVANDYGLVVWGLASIAELIASGRLSLEALLEVDMLGDDLDAWLAESNLMKRTFRNSAVIAGLIERRHPGREKSGRQVTMSTDLIYDVLRKHDHSHILLEAAWADAATGLLDIARLGDFLRRIGGRIRHQALNQVSPLAVPLLLEIGVERVAKSGEETLVREAAVALVAEVEAGPQIDVARDYGAIRAQTRTSRRRRV